MSLASSEKKLTISYALCTILGAAASITVGIAWGHWKPTLDQCVNNKNCSCILYAQHTPSKFLGGNAAPCIWVTFGPLFYVLFCISMTCFHGYRVLFSSRSVKTRTVMSKNDAGETVEMRAVQVDDTNPLPRGFWIALSTLNVIFAVYSFIHFIVFVVGYYRTCNEYRKTLEKLVGIGGSAAPVIYNRLACQSVFDFMDYMQPDSGNAYRDGFIFTGVDLIIGLVSSFFGWMIFCLTSFMNVKTARNSSI